MKKLYALLASVLVAISAMAAPVDFTKVKASLTPQGERAIKERLSKITPMQNFIVPEEDVIGTRSYTIGSMIYTMRMMRDTENEWYRVLQFIDPTTGLPIPPEDMTFEDYPFYNVVVVLSGYDLSKNGELTIFLPFMTFWPCNYYHHQQYQYPGAIPEDEVDYGMVSLEEFCQGAENGYCNVFRECVTYSDGGFNPNPYMVGTSSEVEAWSILNSNVCKSAGAEFMYDGVDCDTYQSGSTIMEWVFRNYLPQTEEFAASFGYPLQFTTASGSSRKVTLNVAFNGTIRTDFTTGYYDLAATEVEIFNTGVMSTKTMGARDPYAEEWGPLTRYYVYGSLSEYLSVDYPSDMNEYNSAQVGFKFKEDTPAEVQLDPESRSYILGALYSAADSKSPENQTWTVAYPSYSFDDFLQVYALDMKPEAGVAIPNYSIGVYDEEGNPQPVPQETYPSYDGFTIYWNGNSESPMSGTKIATNTEIGFNIGGWDQYNNRLNVTYAGKIKYHGNPTDATAYEELDAIGTNGQSVSEVLANDEAAIKVLDGVVYINAVADTEVAVYTVNGMLVKNLKLAKGQNVALELGNGLYVVKAGNEVKKVVL